ncbi:hypothetical protein HPP92_020507 [Vanilla planifolia]|uniref:Survival Motor Neuron Gemin2-binding domain-containing protein n=1 Tax=Vanilla planifolia TaxID=51239 RepID=A0A835Q0U0_VANPL|nr:hypothetical protein HPP92_020896 [Vanilla planifolia]KAG0462031.1 hypothetical protein HPP92_020507 [Vanilla planifolia]
MSKGTELWDDSALINAFNDAMASYKEIHGTKITGGASVVEKHESNDSESDSVTLQEKQDGNCGQSGFILTNMENGESQIDFEGENLNMETSLNETRAAASGVSTLENNFDAKFGGYSDHHVSDYNDLLKQYNELEKKKQEVAEQLNLANYWNYQHPVQDSTSQVQQPAVYGASELDPNITCPWCTCHGLATTFNSNLACPAANMLSGGYVCCPQWVLCCSGHQAQQTKASMVSTEQQNVSKDKDASVISSKTDLSSVLNAWYWAGYQTGRYVLELELDKEQEKKKMEK